MKKQILFIPPSFLKSALQAICFLFIFFVSSDLFSQNTSKTVTAPENEWKLYLELNGVQVYTQNDECHDFKNGTHYEYVMLKFVNTTSNIKNINWEEKLYYNGSCWTCQENSDIKIYKLELSSNETKNGDCGNDKNDILRIFNRFLNYSDKPVLTKFELINFEVK